MPKLIIITHPEVSVDPAVPITEWGLNALGRKRAAEFATSGILSNVTQIWTSGERKARETGEILAAPRTLPVNCNLGLGENDRSATGYLPRYDFEAAANVFFAQPESSYRGWEPATEAQIRIHRTVTEIIQSHDAGDLAIVTHGAVGTLLWCALSNCSIDRKHDQPSQGHFWQADLATLKPDSCWVSLA
ncbi:alpha-ribazole phosphatase [Ruegeria sp. THAF57]|uniref:histidine phosphatase family protein n=1 Tax=Ruegeria sp. THAF57 TaxID=2744555 RepID=UPI0015DDEF15|nr:histidine phosphatase family protein [Ruegeria sp. THAF57]CAD0184219.1 alpha-ribazole phosphatase [Ruegeria sp. THAF57]